MKKKSVEKKKITWSIITLVCLETYYLLVQKFLDGRWKFPWCIEIEIRRVQTLIKKVEVVLERTLGECNKVADFIDNKVFYFVGTESVSYSTFRQLPREAKALLNMDKE